MADNDSDSLAIALKKLASASATPDLARATAGVQAAAAVRLAEAVEHASRQLNDRIEQLGTLIGDFTVKADQGTNLLAKWTMWLAIVTSLLVLAAFAQAYVTWSVGR